MKRRVIIFLTLVLTLSVLSGSVIAEEKNLEFWIIESFTQSEDAPIYKAAEQFNEQYSDIKVEVKPIPAEPYRRKYMNAAMGGGGPDILMLDLVWAAEMSQMNLIKNITPQAEKIKDRFFAGPMSSCVINDKTYALPWYTNNVGLFYNKDMLASVGYNQPPDTWEEFLDIALKLKEKDKYALSFAGDTFGIFLSFPILYSSGARMVNEEGDGPGFTGEEGIRAYKFLTELYTKHKVIPDSLKTNNAWSQLYAPFIQGKTAFVISGDWGIGSIASSNPDFEWDVAKVPSFKGNRATVIGGWNLAINENTDYSDAAWEFLDWMTREDNMWILKSYSRIPAVKEILNTDYAKKDPIMDAFFEQTTIGVPRAGVPEYNAIVEKLGEALDAVIYGKKDVETAFSDAGVEVEKLLSE